MGGASQAMVREEVGKMMEAGIVRESCGPVASPIVVVKQKGKHRLCVDYRVLNEATTPLKFPLPNLLGILERLAQKRWFATMDLKSGYHQVPIAAGSQRFTSFVTEFGQYEFTRVPFGLKNAPAFFQWTMNRVLHGLVHEICEVYIDDIIVFGTDEDSFLRNLRTVLERLHQAKIVLRPDKCCVGLREVTYLGYIVNGDGIRMSEHRIEALNRIPPPKTKTQVRSLYGLLNVFRAFVPNFATITAVIAALCSGKGEVQWNETLEEALIEVRKHIVARTMLFHISYEYALVLRTDASLTGVGAVLLNVIDTEERNVWFLSRAFTNSEKNWSTIEQEAFGIFWAVVSLDHWLRGHPFVVQTDHRNLVFIHKSSVPKIQRWCLRLLEYDFVIEHIPGERNVIADCLSRCCAVEHLPLIAAAHNPVVGHLGVQRTMDLLHLRGLELDGMRDDVTEFIQHCPTCQKCRLGQGSLAASLHTIAEFEMWEVVAVDTVGPLPPDEHGHKYIVVMIDAFSRFVELFATKTASAYDAAVALINVFGRYGAPRYLRSDRGSQFVADLIDELLGILGIDRKLTLAYRPQANGTCERGNQEVMRHLRALVIEFRKKDLWYQYLPLVQRIMNSSVHSATGVAPAKIMFGNRIDLDRGVLIPFDQVVDPETGIIKNDKNGDRYTTAHEHIRRMMLTQRRLIARSQRHQESVVSE